MVERTPEYIKLFLDRFGRTWALGPDQRFGQFVSNVVRPHRDPDGSEVTVDDITDDDFSLALAKSDEDTRRRREESERTRDEREPVKPELQRAVQETVERYERWALKEFGRVGRDPARIAPFLDAFGSAWHAHHERRFGEMVMSAIPLSENPEQPGHFARAGLRLVQDDAYLELLNDPQAASGDDIKQAYIYRGPLGDLLDEVEGGHRQHP